MQCKSVTLKIYFSQTKIRNKLREKFIIFVEYAEDGDDDKNDVDGNFEWWCWWLHFGELNGCCVNRITALKPWKKSHNCNLDKTNPDDWEQRNPIWYIFDTTWSKKKCILTARPHFWCSNSAVQWRSRGDNCNAVEQKYDLPKIGKSDWAEPDKYSWASSERSAAQ